MARLRSENGCMWDREQTHETLRRHLLEETYEVLEAIDTKDYKSLKDELGDLLIQVVFHSQIAAENNNFDIDDVINNLNNKLTRRHPHIFSGTKISSSNEIIRNWERIKHEEKKQFKVEGRLAGMPSFLPSLLFALKLQEKAARIGFDWERKEDVIEKVDEEIRELKEELPKGDLSSIEHEIGDVLFAVVNLSRHFGVDSESALRRCSERFVKRFSRMEKIAGDDLDSMTLEEMDILWAKVKKEEGFEQDKRS